MKEENKYKVNPAAEGVCSAVASIVLWLFIIGAVVLLVLGIMSFSDYDEETGFILIISSVVCILIGTFSWANMKMLVNISRNLYNINDAIRSQHSQEKQIEE